MPAKKEMMLKGAPVWTNLAGRAGLNFDGVDDIVEMPTQLGIVQVFRRNNCEDAAQIYCLHGLDPAASQAWAEAHLTTYGGVAKPKVKPTFLTLPAGAVESHVWLRDCPRFQRPLG
jgi:hypothetical protein